MSFLLNYFTNDQLRIATGILLILLAIMYFVKGVICFTNDRIAFWDGLPKVSGLTANALVLPIKIPIMILSFFIINWKPNPKSLISEAHGMWVMFFFGPFFIFFALGLFVAGLDKLGCNGSETVNLALNGFNQQAAVSHPYVIYNEFTGYRFPNLKKIQDDLTESLSKKM